MMINAFFLIFKVASANSEVEINLSICSYYENVDDESGLKLLRNKKTTT